MATPTLAVQNWFETTLTSGISSTDTTIPLNVVPTPSEGYLIIEPDSSTNREVIYYNSKTGSGVVCPSAAAGRGVDGTTGISHSSGSTVRYEITKGVFDSLQDGSALTGLHTLQTDIGFDYVVSGCVWTADSAGTTRNASMTSGVVRINGRRFTVATVTARSFTASKDTYVDLLYSATDNVATPVYTEATNNNPSPALASNSVRIGIIVTGATSIAAAASINQGQEDRVLPIASSTPYSVTDSLGNLICPRDPQRRLLGYRQILSDATQASTSPTVVTGLSTAVIPPTGRKVKVTVGGRAITNGTANDGSTISIYSGASLNALTTALQTSFQANPATSTISAPAFLETINTPSGSTFYSAALNAVVGGTATFSANAFIRVELV